MHLFDSFKYIWVLIGDKNSKCWSDQIKKSYDVKEHYKYLLGI